MGSEVRRGELPRPPVAYADGTVEDLYVEFTGFGPAGPGFYLMDLAELVENGSSHFWPRLIWDGSDWVPPDAAWFAEHFPVTQSALRYWAVTL